MADDPRVLVLAEMRKQTALLDSIDRTATLVAMALTKLLEAFPKNDAAAPSVNLDGPHGDPVIKAKDPRDWTGEPMNGKRFSECPPAYLDMLADRYDYFAGKDDSTDEKRRYAKLDAARARAWAARLRSGWTPPRTHGRVDETQGEPTW